MKLAPALRSLGLVVAALAVLFLIGFVSTFLWIAATEPGLRMSERLLASAAMLACLAFVLGGFARLLGMWVPK